LLLFTDSSVLTALPIRFRPLVDQPVDLEAA